MMSKTLPRKSFPVSAPPGAPPGGPHRKSLTSEVAIPPPPQYKGVHFAPQVLERRRSLEGTPVAAPPSAGPRAAAPLSIPVEGLPTRPAIPKAETVAIQVRNNPVPLLSAVMKQNSNTSSFVEQNSVKKQPPQPPPKTSSLTSVTSNKQVLGVRDKALAASAAGCEIVFVSPDEGFNEEVLKAEAKISS